MHAAVGFVLNGKSASLAALAFCAASLLVGCGSPPAEFRRYETYAHLVSVQSGSGNEDLPPAQMAEVDSLLAAMFGTPDDPAIPSLADAEELEGADLSQVFDLTRLKMAAGPVGSDENGAPRGLYREHCAHCHGITGDGNGPTAYFLNPYPRDYRPGKFKFKSTPIGVRPTHEDLKKVLHEGVAGTAMPSFKLLTDIEVESLVYYVKYLAIRGESERALLYASSQLNDGERLVNLVGENATAEEKAAQQEQLGAVRSMVAAVVKNWVDAPAKVVEIPQRPKMEGEALVQSRILGRDLFYGAVANCVKCHGDSALGDGVLTDYDDWTKEFIGDGKNHELVHQFEARGMLPPRTIRPRNLRMGVYRGGMRPIDLYWRIKSGIEGSPMPAATMKPEGDAAAKGLTPDDIWHIVNYVESLPYESISSPKAAATLALQREGS
jgi:mono/diheme cytochrome c family protein